MTDYEPKQFSVPITFTDELIATTIKSQLNAVYKQITLDMNTQLYGDRDPPRPLTFLERQRRRIGIYRQRVADAWLVLRGKADIGDGW
jgi:hypothetical protein